MKWLGKQHRRLTRALWVCGGKRALDVLILVAMAYALLVVSPAAVVMSWLRGRLKDLESGDAPPSPDTAAATSGDQRGSSK